MATGVLLINTGTADAPTKEAIRPYLYEFLMDPAIMGMPYFFRRILVKHIVLMRPARTVAHYEAFWTPEGSPFMITSRKQAKLVSEALNGAEGQEDGDFRVELAMRYGNPSIASGLAKLRDAGCEKLVLVPMYPQNVYVCAGTCLKEAYDQLKKLSAEGWTPEVTEVQDFYQQPAYCEALAQSVRDAWTYTPGAKLFVSFHSTMMKDIETDDRYQVQTAWTKERLAADLGIPAEDVILSYQSRFDSRKWLSPFTENVVRQLLDEGVTDICVVCPGFVADNIETCIEVNRDLRAIVEYGTERLESTIRKGGHQPRLLAVSGPAELAAVPVNRFTYVPALGDNPGLIEAVAAAIREVL